jgi:predicted amidohydrolase
MKIAVASPPYPKSLADALQWVEKFSKEAAGQQAKIICFPETYLPGYPAEEFEPEQCSPEQLQSALDKASAIAATYHIAIIIPMDWYLDGRLVNLAYVLSPSGEVLGYQTKNQLDPSEDRIWAPGTQRQIFEVEGFKFGITICHEGFRYPESVRWAAINGAQVVFHPNFTGSNAQGNALTEWGHQANPYYEKAQMMRAMENTIYVATSNCSFTYPESASAIIGPDGACIAYQPYSQPGVAVAEIDLSQATGLLAKRFKSHLYK